MHIVGLTGGIGSGKSTVTRWLQDRAGKDLTVIDADQISRDIVAVGSPILAELQAEFGADILDADGQLRRGELAKRAFKSEETTAALNSITHPAIRQRINEQITQATTQLVLLDHPLLIETNSYELVDEVVVVRAAEEVRLERLVHDRGLEEQDVRNRMQRQLSDAQRARHAHYILDNSGSLAQLYEQLEKWWQQLQSHLGS